ncbi:hypothetical protein [Paraburkholderia phytofirmans]|uniref:hypothetical protein n=1 Tax=Paraburkholderia phytofirmans TaxID=261302 RepID=UPI0038BABB9B
MDYFAIGKTDAANMTRAERFDAWRYAVGKGSRNVTITAKDAQGNPVVRNMGAYDFIVYLTGWPPIL